MKYRQGQTSSKSFYSYQLDKTGNPILSTEQKHFVQAEAGRILGVSAGSIKNILAKKNKTTKDKNGIKYTFSRVSLKKESQNENI